MQCQLGRRTAGGQELLPDSLAVANEKAEGVGTGGTCGRDARAKLPWQRVIVPAVYRRRGEGQASLAAVAQAAAA